MKKRILAVVLCVCMILSMFPVTASAAEDTVTVTVSGIEDHTRGAEVFELINAERENGNIARVRRSAKLTELAMKRAAEIAVYYKANHTRPDGSDFTTIADGVYTDWTVLKENIAINVTESQEVFDKWMSAAADQHNIRNAEFTQVGIGSFYAGEVYCWVVLFGNSTTETEFTTIDGTNVVRRPVNIRSSWLRLSPNGQKTMNLEVDAFESFQITAANSGYANTFPVLMPKGKHAVDAEGNVIAELTIAANGVISVTAVAPGTGTTEVSVYTGQTDPLKLIVNVTGTVATEPTVTTPTEPEPTETQPTEPEPTEPQPTEPQPTEPQPTEPQPTEPEPTEPQPTEPEPTEPQPTEPQPTEPQPTEPQPTEPEPTEPEPTEPEPTEPEPTEPQPTEPLPTEPQPTEPQPTEPQPTEPKPERPEGKPDDSGTWGDNLTWELYGTTLYISGEGGMIQDPTNASQYPWTVYNETVTHLVVEEGVIEIGEYAFEHFSKMVSVQLPKSLYHMKYRAFSQCDALTEVKLPDSLFLIDDEVFLFCDSLKTVVFPAEIDAIPNGMFRGTAIEEIQIPEGVTTIGAQAFHECKNLAKVTLPKSLLVIHYEAFVGTALTDVVIPDAVTEIGSACFAECEKLTRIVLPENLIVLGNSLLKNTPITALEIPGSVTQIGYEAFQNCTQLESLIIPDSVTSIGEYAFDNCPKLTVSCYNLSYAHLYLANSDIPFEVLEEDPNTPVYSVDLIVGKGGTVEIEPEESPANRYVLIVAEPDEGYRLDAVYYYLDTDKEIELQFETISDTEFVLFMPACDVELEFCFAPSSNPFTDVKESDYFYEPVMWAVSRGVTSGVSANRFGPNNACTRAQVVTFLWKAAGAPEPEVFDNPFSDVKETDYFYKAVLWAVENGITSGMSPTQFGSSRPCTRAQVVTFLWRACGSPEPSYTESPFTDVKETDYFYKAVLFAVEYGITSGMSATRFGSGNTCTRAHVVTFLYKTVNG